MSFTSSDEVDTLCSTIDDVLNLASGSMSSVLSSVESATWAVLSNSPQASAVKNVLAGMKNSLLPCLTSQKSLNCHVQTTLDP